jgi:prepilin-type processing-associated H-X9-DG protein
MDTAAPGLRFTKRDAWVVFVIALVLIPILTVLLRANSEQSRRIRCADNLKQIGLAMLLYSNENRGQYPRVRYELAKVVTPVWGTGATSSDPFGGPKPHDVTAALFLLLRTQDITAERFVCPSTDAVPDTFGGKTAKDRANFTDLRKNLSYSMHNPYPDEWAVAQNNRYMGSVTAEFAIAADINPGTAGDDDDVVTKPTMTGHAAPAKRANSNNHRGDGQNVLFADGHVEFSATPFVGVKKDNIFTNQLGQIAASPRVESEDSILLPTDD